MSKHGVAFEEARSVFLGPFSWTIENVIHSDEEQRYLTIRISVEHCLVSVIHKDSNDRIRIISARRATRHDE
ncbi:MAG: BrnT family toxin [Chloroflexota bacterium]|nr:BrnT family toxin [Chloroflexota bacterium]